MVYKQWHGFVVNRQWRNLDGGHRPASQRCGYLGPHDSVVLLQPRLRQWHRVCECQWWDFVPVATGVPGGQLRSTAFAAGDLWLASGSGLYHSTNSAVSLARVGNVVSADAVGFGRAASDTTYPTLFIFGNANNVIGIFRSANAGKSWTRINDDRHQWGSIGTVVGDPRVFGRVYLGTNGRGIIYGDPASGNGLL